MSEDPSGRGPRIGCSIKLVNQSSGEDLDPQALRYRPRGEAGGPGGKQRGAIGSDAATVVEGGKIDWGYMRADTKQYGAGSGQYNMLADEHDQDGDNPPGELGSCHSGLCCVGVECGLLECASESGALGRWLLVQLAVFQFL